MLDYTSDDFYSQLLKKTHCGACCSNLDDAFIVLSLLQCPAARLPGHAKPNAPRTPIVARGGCTNRQMLVGAFLKAHQSQSTSRLLRRAAAWLCMPAVDNWPWPDSPHGDSTGTSPLRFVYVVRTTVLKDSHWLLSTCIE